jgi:hypothetical protein
MIRLAELMVAGHPADVDPVQAEIHAQYQALTELRAISADDYQALARSIVDNETWRAAYEAITPGLAAYQRDAMLAYTTSRLS